MGGNGTDSMFLCPALSLCRSLFNQSINQSIFFKKEKKKKEKWLERVGSQVPLEIFSG